ncbi:MAG: carboxypeptidase M32, partial [Phycisphaerales bacterium]|nr:carboxypeptidase M32 [Phycisphaerales bacterium]
MTTAPALPAYQQLCQRLRAVKLIESVSSLVSWDQETYMPERAADFRSDQMSELSAIAHERATDPRIGELIAACESDPQLKDPSSPHAANLREIRRDYDLAVKIPTDLVAELAKVGSQAQEAWKHAREASDFKAFQPWLERMMDLTRRKAQCLKTDATPELYDALLNQYEPGARASEIDAVFRPLADRLSVLIKTIGASTHAPTDAPLKIAFDTAKQHEFGQLVLKAMGFDFAAGRLDTTTHPFCSGMAPGDTRLTTRYRESHWTDALYSTMHEGGHGLYEQGLPKLAAGSLVGTPLTDAISLGIHESQSRMWENFVGRSREFWRWLTPIAKQHAPALTQFSEDHLYAACNLVKPSLIRVEADEATYNLHVMIRFELERALIAGDLPVKDLPGEWNARYKRYLGVNVPDDRRGCLQDVHWSFGLIGYFPTYTLGNLYAAQFWEKIATDIPDLTTRMTRGDFAPLKAWLNKNIHDHGKRYRA